jgi:hypothetical protein
MPATTLELAVETSAPHRLRFTRNQVEQMLTAGVLEGQKFELLHRELIDKMGRNPPHVLVLHAMLGWLLGVLGIPEFESSLRWN